MGRERELARLAVVLDQAAGGRSTTLLLAGTGGLGASRLLDETERRLAGLPEPFTVIRGWPTAAERASPYGPVVAGLAPMLDSLPDEELATVLGSGAVELGPLMPSLGGRIARLALEPERKTTTAPERRHVRVMERILGVLAALGERRPVLLVLEDLHAADAATRTLVTFMARISRPERLAVVGTYQPDEITRGHPFHNDLAAMADTPRPAERVDLAPLARDELADLVEGIQGERPSASVLLLVAERSKGNPLVAEELLAARREEGGALPGGSLGVIVLARLYRRSPECRRLLRLIAAADAPLTRAALAQVAASAEAHSVRRPPRSVTAPRRSDHELDPDLAAGIAEAVENGWIVTRRTTDGGEAYAYRHELIGRAVAADLLPLQRRRHTAAVAATLDSSPAAATRLWLAAYDIGRARQAALAAAERAEAVNAPQDALEMIDRALELSESLASTGPVAPSGLAGAEAPNGPAEPQADDESPDSLSSLQIRAADAAFAAGRTLRAAAFAESAIGRLDERRDRVRLALLYERLGRYRRAAGDHPGANAAHRRAVQLMPDEPTRERVLVLASLAQLKMIEGTFSEAVRYGEEALRVARIVGDAARAEEAHVITTLAVARGWGHDPESAVAALYEARAQAEERGDLDELFRVIANLTTVLDLIGRRAEAVDIAYEGIAEARRVGLEAAYGNFLRGNAADSLYLLGRWTECRDQAATALEWTPSGVNFVNAIVNLAVVEIESTSGELAARLLGQLLVEAEAVPDAQFSVPIYQAAASHALWRADPADARRASLIGWRLARATEDWVLVARMAATCLEVDAATVAEAREHRDLAAVAAARERSAAVLAEAEAAVERSGVAPSIGSRLSADAALGVARAFRARIDGREDPAMWARLADRWAALSDRYQVARSRWHQAEAALVAPNDARVGRSEARPPLLEAHAIASELGARPLLRELAELAGRALITLPEIPGAATSGWAASAMTGIEIRSDADGVVTVVTTDGRAGGNGWSSGDGHAPRDGRLEEGSGSVASDLIRGFVGEPAPRRADPFGLSPREREVLQLIAQGRTNREIGEHLFISQKTVGVHVGNILAKLDVSGRVEAAAVAIRLGLTEKR